MTHWKLTLAYNGSGFHGWQIQPGLVTVQGTLAEAIERITGEQLLPQGSGRTDAGVHALAQVASFALEAPIPPASLQRALNRVLRPELRVLAAETVPASFHARHSARGKLYEYRIFERRRWSAINPAAAFAEERICSPFLAPYVWDCRWPLDLEAMQQAASLIIGTHDFSAMAASSRDPQDESEDPVTGKRRSQPNPVKTIYAAEWFYREDLLTFRVRGSGFLHHMVRNLVGTMVDIGRGSLTPHDIPRILASRNRSEAGPTAPASGLYLVHVTYEDHPVSAPDPEAP